MNRIVTLALCLIVAAVLAAPAHGQEAVAWSAGYPKTGTNNGTILVKGTTTAAMGWSFVGTADVLVWPKNSGVVQVTTITVNTGNGNWGESEIGGLVSGQDYNVIVQVNIKSGANFSALITPPKVVQAK